MPVPTPCKQDLRRQGQARRSALPEDARRQAAEIVGRRVSELADEPEAVVAGYVAMREELDPLPALRGLVGRAVTALPVVVGRDRALTFRRWRPGEPLEPGLFGTRQPGAAHEEVEPDILLVPLLGFDQACARLGYGAGHYDRTLAGLRARKRVLAIGLAFEAQALDAIPTDAHDQPLDFVVTEARVVRRQVLAA